MTYLSRENTFYLVTRLMSSCLFWDLVLPLSLTFLCHSSLLSASFLGGYLLSLKWLHLPSTAMTSRPVVPVIHLRQRFLPYDKVVLSTCLLDISQHVQFNWTYYHIYRRFFRSSFPVSQNPVFPLHLTATAQFPAGLRLSTLSIIYVGIRILILVNKSFL